MLPLRSGRFARLLDKIGIVTLVACAASLVLVFAQAYLTLSPTPLSPNGLRLPEAGDVGFDDALYFSFTTQTTTAYGDIRPVGWARALAGVQVSAGLLFIGLLVAKITSIPGRELRRAVRRASGDWVETTRLPGGKIMVTFSRISFDGTTIRYDGDNYLESGATAGFFQAELIDVAGSRFRFHYSNRDSHTDYFVEGITSIQFKDDSRGNKWTRCVGTTHDFGTKETSSFQAVRASQEEEFIIRGIENTARVSLVKRYIEWAGEF
jgi:hypothetical protein